MTIEVPAEDAYRADPDPGTFPLYSTERALPSNTDRVQIIPFLVAGAGAPTRGAFWAMAEHAVLHELRESFRVDGKRLRADELKRDHSASLGAPDGALMGEQGTYVLREGDGYKLVVVSPTGTRATIGPGGEDLSGACCRRDVGRQRVQSDDADWGLLAERVTVRGLLPLSFGVGEDHVAASAMSPHHGDLVAPLVASVAHAGPPSADAFFALAQWVWLHALATQLRFDGQPVDACTACQAFPPPRASVKRPHRARLVQTANRLDVVPLT